MNNPITKILLIVLTLVLVGAVVFSTEGVGDANYKITHDGITHYVEAYTKEYNGQCVYLAEKELRLCGEIAIQKLNIEE